MADETTPQPAALAVPGIIGNDGHEHFWSPRNIIAFATIAAMIASIFLPYFVAIPGGRNGDLVLSGSEKLLTVAMLILAFYFGTTVSASRTSARAENNAAAAGAMAAALAPRVPVGPAASGAPVTITPPAKIILEEPDHAQADASRAAEEPASVPTSERLQPRDGGPPE